ncbi:MAG: hypothetical protein GC134_00230 [Proteobacteria bacterium]|nr:hypothetical protein [Pseudomonadota bacterium]
MIDRLTGVFQALLKFSWYIFRLWLFIFVLSVGLSLLGHTPMQATKPAYTGQVCTQAPQVTTTRVFSLMGAQGTGFGVAGNIITNNHVVGWSPVVLLIDENWHVDFGWVRATARDDSDTAAHTDLAVVRPLLGTLTVNDLPMARTSTAGTVYTRGFPKGSLNDTFGTMWPTVSENVLDTDRVVTNGASGSPVVNCKGEVVGVIATQLKLPLFMTPDGSLHSPRFMDLHNLSGMGWVTGRGGIWFDNGAIPVERLQELLASLSD